jgi:hypothetical protein
MKNDQEILQFLIKGGLIGGALGALLSKEKAEGTLLGALAGAAIFATFNANEAAQKTNVPMYVVEDGYLYQIDEIGKKTQIRKVEKPKIQLEKHFKLT